MNFHSRLHYLHVKKRDLPVPLVIEDDNGTIEVMELAPSGPKKLGAYVRTTADWIKQKMRAMLRK